MSDDNHTCPSCRQAMPSLVPPQWLIEAYVMRFREERAEIATAKDTPDDSD